LQLVDVHGHQLAVDAEEAAHRQHHLGDIVARIHQQLVDGADLLVVIVVDRRADHLAGADVVVAGHVSIAVAAAHHRR
jgi:hypothetical protein